MFKKGLGSNVQVLKFKMGNMEGFMNATNPKFCQTFKISYWMMSKLYNRCFLIHFLFGIKIYKMGTTITQHFAYIKPMGFYPQFWWERWGDYEAHLEEIFSGFLFDHNLANTCPFGMTKGSFWLHNKGL